MEPHNPTPAVLASGSISEYFQQSLGEALARNRLRTSGEVQHYLTNLLTGFARSERLFDSSEDGLGIRPLALLYADALNAPSPEVRGQALQRLGDIALFIAGLFAHSLSRRLVDVDYYIAMGGSAYGVLGDRPPPSRRGRAMAGVFQDLAARFTAYVDVLADVGEQANLQSDRDLMRLYEIWLKTGSNRAAQRLRQAGIQPSEAAISRASH